jgi:membrane-bound lytic murein transglycosylase A
MLSRFYILSLLLTLVACAGKQDHFEARQIGFEGLADWAYEDHRSALEAFKNSCPILANKSRPATNESGISINSSLWDSLCNDAQQVTGNIQAREFFEKRFVPYRIANNGREQGLFTGYYEPVLYGSLHKGGDFKYPLYAAPSELKNQKPYYSRAEIERGALAKRGLEIVWVDDPVMLFFMQIQGSGRVRLQDGRELRIGYADQNGQPYVSLGKIMGDEGYLSKDVINFFTIRQWLYENPRQAVQLMQRNPSYVFFKIIDKPIVVGAIGAPLTPKRSIAIDSNYIPYGHFIWKLSCLVILEQRLFTIL